MAIAPELAPRIDAEDRRIYQMIQDDLRDYWNNPLSKVLNQPIRAIIYSIAIKIIFWCVAVLFPFISYTMIGISVALIDRIAFNHFTVFFQSVINTCKVYVNDRVRTLRNAVFEVIDGVFDYARAAIGADSGIEDSDQESDED